MGDAEVTAVDRMSDFETLMWQMERSPRLSNAFANLTVFDKPLDRDRFMTKMAAAVEKVPRLHQYPATPVGRLANPIWVDDADFDLERHIRWVNLGGDATDAELYDYTATLTSQPFDRRRPLWEFVVIDGISGGRTAMVQRMHHTITDGEGGIRLSTAFIDLERSPAPSEGEGPRAGAEPSPARTTGPEHADADCGPTSARGESEHGRGLNDAVREVGENVLRRGAQVVAAMGTAFNMALHPGDAADVARSAARQMRLPSRRSPLWTERSLRRWFATTTLELAEVRTAAHRLGGSVNDFFVAGAVSGAAHYHLRSGSPVDHLRLSMPVSVRRDVPREERGDAMAGGNAFSPTQMLVPTAEMSARERFEAVHRVLADTRGERAIGMMNGTAAVINLLPTAALLATGERATAGIDFVCSNVRAAPFELYIAGALMLANFPIGPLAGTAWNITTMSYNGRMFIGLLVDPAAVTDPDLLLETINTGYAELFRTAED